MMAVVACASAVVSVKGSKVVEDAIIAASVEELDVGTATVMVGEITALVVAGNTRVEASSPLPVSFVLVWRLGVLVF